MPAAKSRKKLFDPAGTEPYPISRTGIEAWLSCPRTFWYQKRLGIKPPGMPSMTINRAIDVLLKREFDACREERRPHPVMLDNGIDAVPLSHPNLAAWRSNVKGIRFLHADTRLEVYGAPDDVWARPDGELIVCDYKALASKEEAITLDSTYRQGYRRQVECYMWLLRMNGFRVSKAGYLLFANAVTTAPALDNRLTFRLCLTEVIGNDGWIEPTLLKVKETLMLDAPPPPAPDCELCEYVGAVAQAAGKDAGR
jgi:CRISPR/Cas system-associated exonuclease Cas4 (RecB family)